MRGGPVRERLLSERVSTSVAVLLAIAAASIALVGTRAALLSDSAQELSHLSLREDVKRSAAIVEDVRAVYQDELFVALQMARARVHGEELRRAARDAPPDVATILSEQGVTEGFAGAIGLGRSELTKQREKYELGFAEYDLLTRLADLRAERPLLVELDPDATQARSEGRYENASLLVGTTLLLAIAFLCGALGHGFPRMRESFVWVGYGAVAVGLCAALLVELAG